MSLWYLVFLLLAAQVLLLIVQLFVPLPSVLKTKLVRTISSIKHVFFGIAVVFLLLSLMEYTNSLKYDTKTGHLQDQLLNQVKEFRSQRNFYMCVSGFVLSIVMIGVNGIQKKVLDLEDKIQLLTKDK